MAAAEFGEFAFIERLLKPLARGAPAALGLADDAAVLRPLEGHDLVVAKDGIVEGVHFLPECPPESVAHKLLGVNVSDLAAMGAAPLAYLTFIARPPRIDQAWFERFAAGLGAAQGALGLALIGGDTTSTPGPLTLSCTGIGTVPTGTELRREGARPGDVVCVSGTLGDAALGLRILRGLAVDEDDALFLVDRYRRPQPRAALGQGLRGVASAMLDVSDGLLADLGHILKASAVGARIEATCLPLSAASRRQPGARDCALGGGDDYELLFTVSPFAFDAARSAARRSATPITPIGTITVEPDLVVVDEVGRQIAPNHVGWRHF